MSMNGTGYTNLPPKPKLEAEQGSIFDYIAGDLVFSQIPGTSRDEGLVYDYREPTVLQIEEMLQRDGKASSLERVLTMPVMSGEWRVESTKQGGGQDIADWVDDMFRRATIDGGMQTPMVDIISQKAEAFVMRRSYHEKVWKLSDDNKYVYDKVAWRPPNTCTLLREKRTGELRGFTQWVQGETDQTVIKLPYADVYVHGANRNPNKGTSDLTVTYHNYRVKEKLKYLWYTYCEVLSLPRQVVLATSEPNAKKAAQAIAALKNAGVAGIPTEWVDKIQEITVAGNGEYVFQQAITYLDTDSALSLLAGFTDLPGAANRGGMGAGGGMGRTSGGSYALAQSAQNFFEDLITGYANEIAAQITNSLIADLVRYNFGMKAPIPRFVIDLEQQKLQKAFNLLQSIIVAPQINVPMEFVSELIMSVARQLDMNTDAIQEALDQEQQLASQQATTAEQAANASITGAANVGAQVANAAQASMGRPVGPGSGAAKFAQSVAGPPSGAAAGMLPDNPNA